MAKQATSLRLTDDARRIVARLAGTMGLSRTGVIELAIRELLNREKREGRLKP